MSIRLLVADDHELVRTGVVSLLADDGIEVVAQASNGEEAVRLAHEHRPDIVLMDIRMTDGDGLTALEQIHRDLPDSKVVMLSTYDNPTYIARAHAMGASDYVLKGATREQLLGCIRAAAAGKAPSEFGEMHRVAGQMATRAKNTELDVTLTQRELQVLRHLALGLSNKEIASSLEISVETVKEHVQHLLRKMDATDRTQAAVWAVRQGLV
jgi:DNA-binding NarL/FixJ family response regulator